MNRETIALWWAIAGLITCIIGIYRHLKGKSDEPDPFLVMAWFLLPFLFLPYLIIRIIVKRLKSIK